MLPELSKYIIEKWDILYPDTKRPSKISYMGIAGSIEGGTTTFLAFPDERGKLAFVVRVPRNSNKINQILAERDVLLYLHTLSPFLRNSVPKVIVCEKIADTVVLVESAVDGKPMLTVLDSDGLPELESTKTNIRLVKEWLVRLNYETKKTEILLPDLFERYINEQIEKLQSIFALSKHEQDYLKQIPTVTKSFRYHKIDLSLIHGDFCRHNILVSKNKSKCSIRVIDWAFSEKEGFPFYDFFFFLSTFFLQIRKERGIKGYVKAFRDTYFSTNKYSNLVKQYLIEYSQELKIDLSLIRIFFALFLIDKAILEYQQLLSLSGEGFVPGFGIYSSAESAKNKGYHDLLKEQLWIHFFRMFVKEQKWFIINGKDAT